jgi:thioesterase domain-containing protein
VSGESYDTLLPRYLGEDQPLYSLMHPCHYGKPMRFESLEDLASHHIRELRTVQAQGPYFLGGSCIGGMVAFEMAQQLLQQGQRVALLALLDLATIKNCKSLATQVSQRESF